MSLSIVLQFILSFIFALSVYSKLLDIQVFLQEVNSLRMFNKKLTVIAVYLLLVVEFSLVVFYIFDVFHVWRELVTIMVLSFFILILVKKKKIRLQGSCSCFGNNSILNKYPIQRNLILIMLSILNIKFKHVTFELVHSLILCLITLLLIILIDIRTTHKNMKVVRNVYGKF